jgi:hypothetical protein
MRSQVDAFKFENAIRFGQYTATKTGSTIDTRGFGAVTFIVEVGAVATADGSNTVSFSLDHSDDGSTWTAVGASKTKGDGITIDATGDAHKVGALGYIGGKRYVRLVGTETGTTDANYGALALLGLPELAPVGDSGLTA